ncbi:MAG: response regulator [Chlorobi bacterium]|nr:response regulator [Chlorobiota bacterium]
MTKKILIIDDEPEITRMLKRLFERAGFKVQSASNGEDAMFMIAENNFDLVVTDIIMPKKEGIETITSIKKDFPDIKIIAMSGGGRYSPEGYLKSAKMLGADKIFKKPFDHKEILLTVERMLDTN